MITKVICLIALCLSLSCVGCESSASKTKRLKSEQDVVTAKEMMAFSSTHDAITDWQQALKSRTYSIDVEPLFLRADHRPFLFYANLEDIKRENDHTVLQFRTTPTDGEPIVELMLACNGCNLQELKKPNHIGDFAIIAVPSSVVKAVDGPEDGPDFILRGTFSDARYIDDYAFDKAVEHRRVE